MKWCTRNGGDPQGKQFVYVTGGNRTLDCYTSEKAEFNIVKRILQKANCAIALREELTSVEEIAQFQLVVVLVTSELFGDDSVIELIKAAQSFSVPILPLMLESDLDSRFNELFNDLQCLYPFINDSTQEPFEKKLQDFLDAMLIGKSLEKEVKESFDGYIFLSYRKKDRYYARQLIKLIHSFDFCRDIAIWYDEAIIPGENFNSAINQALLDSDVFMLLVTPSILENGNYVHKIEYPTALKNGKTVLAIEMKPTDRDELRKSYKISECISAENTEAIRNALYSIVSRIPKKQHKDMAYHTYLMSIAYLYGIDVEVDVERGISLLNEAIENGCPYAAGKLSEMYKEGRFVEKNPEKFLYWLGQKVEMFNTDNITVEHFYEKICSELLYECELRKADQYSESMNQISSLIADCSLMENYLSDKDVYKDLINCVLDIHSRAYSHLAQCSTILGYPEENKQVFLNISKEIMENVSLDNSSQLDQQILIKSNKITAILNSTLNDQNNVDAKLDEAQCIIDSMADSLCTEKATDRRLSQWKRNQPLIWYLRGKYNSQFAEKMRYLNMAENEFIGFIKEFPDIPTLKDDIASVYADKFMCLLYHDDIEEAFQYAKLSNEMALDYYFANLNEKSRNHLRDNIIKTIGGDITLFKKNKNDIFSGINTAVAPLMNHLDNEEIAVILIEAINNVADLSYQLKIDDYALFLYNMSYSICGEMLKNKAKQEEWFVRESCKLLPVIGYLTFTTGSADDAYDLINENLLLIDKYSVVFKGENVEQFVFDNCLCAVRSVEQILNILQSEDNAKIVYKYMYTIIKLELVACRSAVNELNIEHLEQSFMVIINYYNIFQQSQYNLPPLTIANILRFKSQYHCLCRSKDDFITAVAYAKEAIRIFDSLFNQDFSQEYIQSYYTFGVFVYKNLMLFNNSAEKLNHYIRHVLRLIMSLYKLYPKEKIYEKAMKDNINEMQNLVKETYINVDELYEDAKQGDDNAYTSLVSISETLYTMVRKCDVFVECIQLLNYVNSVLDKLDEKNY